MIPESILSMVNHSYLFVLNDSGGKDSQRMRIAVRQIVPREQLLVVHASLGDSEWPGALEHAQAGAERDGIPFIVARAVKSFVDMVDRRFATRPEAPSWPSADNRQCTSDLKRGPIEREIRRYMKARGLLKVVNCMGIRAAESHNRAKLKPLVRSGRNSKAGRDWWDWLPIFDLTDDEVFQGIEDAGEQLHYAYGTGNRRLSCKFCIMACAGDLRNAAVQFPDTYRQYVQLEHKTGYTMHQSRRSLEEITGIAI